MYDPFSSICSTFYWLCIHPVQFPNSVDMTIEVQVSYKALVLGIKVEEVTVMHTDNSYRKRFTVELDNPLWPFGIASYKEYEPYSKVSISLQIQQFLFCFEWITMSLN